MMTFWLSAAASTLIALAFILPPFLRKISVDDRRQQKMNIAIYQERLAELNKADLSAAEKAQAKQELDKSLVEDLGHTQQTSQHHWARWPVWLLAVLVPTLAFGGYYWTMQPQVFDPQAKVAPEALPMAQIMVQLEQRVKDHPDNLDDAMMLARTYQAMGEHAKAKPLYQKLMTTEKAHDPDVLVNYAETLAILNERHDDSAKQLIDKALSLSPQHVKGLWLAGLIQIQAKQPEKALSYWQTLLAQLSPESEDWQHIKGQIAELKALLGDDSPAVAPTAPSPEINGKKLHVNVKLSAQLQAKVPDNAVLLVYARPATGAKMPLAMVKKAASDLPLTVTLDDSSAMMAQMKLSNFTQVVVMAKISPQASAQLAHGDLVGQSVVVDLSQTETQAELEINQISP